VDLESKLQLFARQYKSVVARESRERTKAKTRRVKRLDDSVHSMNYLRIAERILDALDQHDAEQEKRAKKPAVRAGSRRKRRS
jgi:hypothetical protein